MTQNAPYLVQELDRLKEARAAAPDGDQAAEMAFWEQSAKLGVWFIVNRGSDEQPVPMVLDGDNGKLALVFSTPARAEEAAPDGKVVGVPMPVVLDWLASFGQYGVTGVSLDRGAWIPLPNLSYLKRWVPAEGFAAITTQPIVAAPDAQPLMDAYVADPSDEGYVAVLKSLSSANLLVVLDPEDSTRPTHIVNQRGEKVVLAFTDSTRGNAIYGGKAVDIQERPAVDVLAQVVEDYDVLIIDPQHPSAFALPADMIRAVLDTQG